MGPDDASGSGSIRSSHPIFGSHQQVSRQSGTQATIRKIDHVTSSIVKLKDQLDDTNWIVWCERIRHIFMLCNVGPYVYSTLPCPDAAIDADQAEIWIVNDVYAQILITQNITCLSGPLNGMYESLFIVLEGLVTDPNQTYGL